MTAPDLAVVILAAGHGTRMKSQLPKVLHPVGGRSMLAHVMATADSLGASTQIVVTGEQAPEVGDSAKATNPHVAVAIQAPPRGTGDAVIQATPYIENFDGVVLVLYADTPLLKVETLARLIGQVRAGADIAVLGFRPDDPGAYGRLKIGHDGDLEAIIEVNDATPSDLAIDFVNAGVMAIGVDFLRRGLKQLSPNNAKHEYYLTDLVTIARSENARAVALEASDENEVIGVNSRSELALAEEIFQADKRRSMMEAGVTLIDPLTTYFSYDTTIEPDVVIEPNVFFGPGVVIRSGAVIRAFSHIEGAEIGSGAVIGPFARLRPGAVIGEGARVGNYVEIKKARLGAGAKANHLAYIGDAEVGADANIGAGVITCNYDGYGKHKTHIGAGAFVGSNSALVAPVSVGDGAYVGSGSVITKPVSKDALAVARGRQTEIPGWAAKFRKANGDNH